MHPPTAAQHPSADTITTGKPEPWFVLGAGAMGCLWTVALVQHLENTLAQPVTLLLRDNKALARYPGKVAIEHYDGSVSSVAVPALSLTDFPHNIPKIKRLLLSCKAHDAEAAMAGVSHLLDDKAIVVLLQNGIRFQQHLSLSRPPGTVFCLSTSFGAWLREPFYAVAAGKGDSWLGHLHKESGADLHHEQQQLLSELPGAALNIKVDENMQHRLWEKLAINCAINGLTVIYDCNNGELLTISAARDHCLRLCAEISTLMRMIEQTPDMPELWQRVQHVAQATAQNVSSTLQDIRNGRQTEIGQLNGYLIELAALHHLPCPLNQQVLAAVLESGRP
jgi:2-dehydropantoate 2-reductase